jgi:hypothetical protein
MNDEYTLNRLKAAQAGLLVKARMAILPIAFLLLPYFLSALELRGPAFPEGGDRFD